MCSREIIYTSSFVEKRNIALIQSVFKFITVEKNKKIDNYSKIDFSGHTLFKVIETDSGRVLYKPCGANIEKFKIYKLPS